MKDRLRQGTHLFTAKSRLQEVIAYTSENTARMHFSKVRIMDDCNCRIWRDAAVKYWYEEL